MSEPFETWWAVNWSPASSNYLLSPISNTETLKREGIPMFLKWDRSKNPNRCPCIFTGIINNNPRLLMNYDIITSPLTINFHSIKRKTSNALMNTLNNGGYYNSYGGSMLRKVEYKDDSVYYGTPGLILNEDMEILIIMAVNFKCNSSNDRLTFEDSECIISTKVFENSKGPVEKYIINKIIPNITSTRLYSNYLLNNRVTKIAIQDCSDFIVKPSPCKSELTTADVDIRNNIIDGMMNSLIEHEEQEDN